MGASRCLPSLGLRYRLVDYWSPMHQASRLESNLCAACVENQSGCELSLQCIGDPHARRVRLRLRRHLSQADRASWPMTSLPRHLKLPRSRGTASESNRSSCEQLLLTQAAVSSITGPSSSVIIRDSKLAASCIHKPPPQSRVQKHGVAHGEPRRWLKPCPFMPYCE